MDIECKLSVYTRTNGRTYVRDKSKGDVFLDSLGKETLRVEKTSVATLFFTLYDEQQQQQKRNKIKALYILINLPKLRMYGFSYVY